MTYKSRTRRNAVLVDSEVIAASQKATGIDPMVAIREKHPDAEFIFSSRDRFPFNPYEHMEAFRRGFHDEMTFDFGAAEERVHALMPIVVGHNNAPYFFEDVWNRSKAMPRFTPRTYPYQEEALRKIKAMGETIRMDVPIRNFLQMGVDIHGRMAFDIETRDMDNFQPLVINPRLPKAIFDSYAIMDEAHVWDRNPVRKELSWGLDIRYKFAREDGKTHAQICKQELRTIKKRRKAAMKQLDECGARYEAALKENENVL